MAWTILGAVSLFGAVFSAAFSQAAIYECAPCSGDFCGPDGQTCPGTPYFLSIILIAFGLASAAITVGLSDYSAVRSNLTEAIPRRNFSSNAREYPRVASFLFFFGWGPAAYGLLQLWSLFAQCIEPCAPGFDLQGIPLAMASTGLLICATGGVLFVVLRGARVTVGGNA